MVQVDDRGRGFDFDKKIQELESDVGVEHGLLRAARKDPVLRPRRKWVGIEIVGMHGTVPRGYDSDDTVAANCQSTHTS
jgi:hypothetical protein